MKTILIVDDLAEFRHILETTFKMRGFNVLCASTGLEALQSAEQNKPALMLLDIDLPDMDGIEVLKRMKANPAIQNLPVFLLAEVTLKHKAIEAAELGVWDYMFKSRLSFEKLISRIEKILQELSAQPPKGDPALEKTIIGITPSKPTQAARRSA